MKNIETLTRMSLYLIDVIADIKLSKIAKQKSDKNRQQLTEAVQKELHQQRQEVRIFSEFSRNRIFLSFFCRFFC